MPRYRALTREFDRRPNNRLFEVYGKCIVARMFVDERVYYRVGFGAIPHEFAESQEASSDDDDDEDEFRLQWEDDDRSSEERREDLARCRKRETEDLEAEDLESQWDEALQKYTRWLEAEERWEKELKWVQDFTRSWWTNPHALST